MLGLDSKGYSIRKKLDKPMLREIQTEVAKILEMERGKFTSYSKEEYQKITNELKPQNEYADKKEYNKAFTEKAKELGCDYVATGHYAKTEYSKCRNNCWDQYTSGLHNAKTCRNIYRTTFTDQYTSGLHNAKTAHTLV